MFGLPHNKEVLPRLWWGARGIYHPSRFSHMEFVGKRKPGKRRKQKEVYTKTQIDVPPDRFNWADTVSGAEHLFERRKLIKFVNDRAMKAMFKHFKKHEPDPSSSDVFTFEEGGFRFEGSPSGSYGYFYMGAWKVEDDVASYPPGCRITDKFIKRKATLVTA